MEFDLSGAILIDSSSLAGPILARELIVDLLRPAHEPAREPVR